MLPRVPWSVPRLRTKRAARHALKRIQHLQRAKALAGVGREQREHASVRVGIGPRARTITLDARERPRDEMRKVIVAERHRVEVTEPDRERHLACPRAHAGKERELRTDFFEGRITQRLDAGGAFGDRDDRLRASTLETEWMQLVVRQRRELSRARRCAKSLGRARNRRAEAQHELSVRRGRIDEGHALLRDIAHEHVDQHRRDARSKPTSQRRRFVERGVPEGSRHVARADETRRLFDEPARGRTEGTRFDRITHASHVQCARAGGRMGRDPGLVLCHDDRRIERANPQEPEREAEIERSVEREGGGGVRHESEGASIRRSWHQRAMVSLLVPALVAPKSRNLATRRRTLVQSAELPQLLTRWMIELRRGGAARWQPLADLAGLPLGEVVASPFGLRAVALGVATGATTAHVETRALLPWPESFGELATSDPTHGVWDAGKLRVGKYQSFQADAPHATYDPSHVAKWGPHELLHRAVGFFFAKDATRFEHYVGARLNELLPVALWYGHDQLARLDEDDFVRSDAQHPAPIENARWLVEPEDALVERAERTAKALLRGIAHLERELDAIDRELATGRCVPTPIEVGGARLDASSDATAYVVGHVARLRDPSVVAILDTIPGELGRFDSLASYRAQIESVHDALLFSRVSIDEDTIASLRARRTVWDWLHRAAHTGGNVRALAKAAGPELRGEREVDEARWLDKLTRLLGEEGAGAVLADGIGGVALGQLREGVRSVTPRVESYLDDEALASFATSAELLARAPLGERIERLLETAEAPVALRELATLERAIAEARPSDEATHLCEPMPTRLRDGVVVGNDRFVAIEATHDVVALHAGEAATPGHFTWLVGAHDDGVSILPCSDEERRFFERACVSASPVKGAKIDAAWLKEAVVAGVLSWRPR